MAEIHGPGGKFHLHGGKLESMTGDADMDRPAAGICSRDLDRAEDVDMAECVGECPKCPPFIHGHGGYFHLYNGHLVHVTGDADVPYPPPAGMSSQELSTHH